MRLLYYNNRKCCFLNKIFHKKISTSQSSFQFRSKIAIYLATITLFLSTTSLFCETIRGLVVEEISLKTDTKFEQTAGIALEEMASLQIEGLSQFIDAIQIEIHLSNTLKQYADSFGLTIHKNIKPKPVRGEKSFTGEKVFFHHLPFLNRMYISIPVNRAPSAESGPQTASFELDHSVIPDEFPLLIAMIPIMKGIPDSVLEKKFYLTFRTVLEKKGLVELSIHRPPDTELEAIRLFIDNNLIEVPEADLIMDSGIHQLKVESSNFQEVNASFTIESGQKRRVEIILEELTSELRLDAPESAEVFLDGEKLRIGDEPVRLKEGTHLVRIKIDEYSFSKRFTSQRGKNYHLSIIFDIIVNED